MERKSFYEEKILEIYPYRLTDKNRRYMKIKRIIDLVIALLCLILLSPIFLLVAIGIKVESPKENIFFLQERLGKEGKIFKILKFRSMKSGTPNNRATGELENPEKYISSIGKFIRKSSIDELPQLWNVVKGDMSIIGPRPLILVEEGIHKLRDSYGVYQISPGITGLAQINGRDTVSAYEKVYYDWKYLKNYGIVQDIKVLLFTVGSVLRHEGYQEGKCIKSTEEVPNETYIHCRE